MKLKNSGCWEFYIDGADRQTTWYHLLSGRESAYKSAEKLLDCILY